MCVCYLDLAGSLDVVDGVEGLLHRLPQSHNAVISQHQYLHIMKSTLILDFFFFLQQLQVMESLASKEQHKLQ